MTKNDTEEANAKKLTFTVNGTHYKTNDPVLSGREVLQKAGFKPASDHVLIERTNPGTRSVGLDEKIDLATPGREIFHAFVADRTYNFTIDELGYEWGAPTITEAQLREVTSADDSLAFVLERTDQPDQVIEDGESVDLNAKGTEHIRTTKRIVRIIVNAREYEVPAPKITYDQVVALAFNPVPSGPEVLFTVTYRKGPPQNPKGTLPEGQSVTIKNGMIFNVIQTNRS